MAAHMAYLDMVEAGGFIETPDVDVRGSRLVLPAVVEDVRPLDVAGVVTAVVERFREDGLDIRLRQAGAGEACGRATDLAVAVESLLDNAGRFAPTSPVDVHVVAISDRVEVSVIDRGPGLSALTAETALADPAYGGGGGLSVARELMRRSGGDLLLRNRIGGASFVLTLPTSDADRRRSHAEVTVRPRAERRVGTRV
jgi:signal transduction histidine kinase